MRQEALSLFEARPSRAQLRTAAAVPVGLAATFLLLRAIGDRSLPEAPAIIAVFDVILLLAHMVTATLLFGQASVFRSRALLALGATYAFIAFIILPHALTFPGVFAPAGLLGGRSDSAAWLYVFWGAGFLLGIIAYAGLKRAGARANVPLRRPARAIVAASLGAAAVASSCALLATKGAGLLPPLVVGAAAWHASHMVAINLFMVICSLLATALLWRPNLSVLDMWLLVALGSWPVQILFVVATTGRFTLFWYVGQAEGLIPRLAVMFALLAEAHRIYARLALARLAQQREREGRLLSMDAVAAAMAHEIRQPLTAMVANAGAAFRWLDRIGPRSDEVATPLRSIIADGHRAAGMIESVRGSFARRIGERAAIDVNDLVREAVSLMASEFALRDVSLRLELEERLPAIVADRIQLEQVLLNLFANSVESLAETEGRERRLAIRSLRDGEETILVEVCDCGIGIPPGETDRLFEPFFTTKRKGVGVGLSLCRSIVESHGGRLWASPGDRFGATFHLQLPRLGMAA